MRKRQLLARVHGYRAAGQQYRVGNKRRSSQHQDRQERREVASQFPRVGNKPEECDTCQPSHCSCPEEKVRKDQEVQYLPCNNGPDKPITAVVQGLPDHRTKHKEQRKSYYRLVSSEEGKKGIVITRDQQVYQTFSRTERAKAQHQYGSAYSQDAILDHIRY